MYNIIMTSKYCTVFIARQGGRSRLR